MVQICRVTPVYVLGNGKRATTKLDFSFGTEPTPAELQSIANAARTPWIADQQSIYAPQLEFAQVEAQLFEREAPTTRYPNGRMTPFTTAYVASSGVQGTATGEQGAPGARTVIKLRTATPGKSFRGRQYWPAPPEPKINGAGWIDPTWRASLLFAHDAIVTAVTGGAWDITEQVVVSTKLDAVTAVTGASVDEYLKSQRRSNLRT